MTINEFKQAMLLRNSAMVAYARKKKLRKLLRVLLINALIISLTLFTLMQMDRAELRMPILGSTLLICVVYTLTAKPRGLILSRPYVGVIEQVTVETYVGGHDDNNIRRVTLKNKLILSIRTENGSERCVELERKYERYYRVGDHVGVWSSLAFPILLDAEEGRATVCWWCGSINRPEDRECLHCGRDRFSR